MVARETFLRWGCMSTALVIATLAAEFFKSQGVDEMTKLEMLTVLKSLNLAIKNGTKEDVQELIQELIREAESDKSSK